MTRCINGDIWRNLNIFSTCYFSHIKDCQIIIGIEILTYFNVPAIVTVEWCFHPDIFACFSKNILDHLRRFLTLSGWRQLIKIIDFLLACLSVFLQTI